MEYNSALKKEPIDTHNNWGDSIYVTFGKSHNGDEHRLGVARVGGGGQCGMRAWWRLFS